MYIVLIVMSNKLTQLCSKDFPNVSCTETDRSIWRQADGDQFYQSVTQLEGGFLTHFACVS